MRVLVIHTCPATLQSICRALREIGLECECLSSAAAAAYVFAFSTAPFDAVFAEQTVRTSQTGDMLSVFKALQPGIALFTVDTVPEARQAVSAVQRKQRGDSLTIWNAARQLT